MPIFVLALHLLHLSKTHLEHGQTLEMLPSSKRVLDKFDKCKPEKNPGDCCGPLIDTLTTHK